ncbi:DUF3825 domain-containing protein [Marinactinospora rubrisoli]|uniref:DUF3825 domain-containing protein n=1 Tax=Marinactinospora rubrisoli TaxID=2715399 RepID=A0ABW2KQ22_9ACTN
MTTVNHALASAEDLARLKRHFDSATSPAPPTPASRSPRPSRRTPGNALYEYAYMGKAGPDLFGDLADMAEPENWDRDSPGDKGILRNYICWTFERARQQGKISASVDASHSAFNTGLATARQEVIYGLFRRNSRTGHPWDFVDWCVEGKHDFMDHFPPSLRPDFVTYTDNPADYVYDWRRELIVSVDHILDGHRLARFPAPLQRNPHLACMALKGAIDTVLERVRRNHRTAVPVWYPALDTVQLLLPLSLVDAGVVDLALVVSPQGEFYRGHTVFTPAMAYNNARLVGRPDSEWLRPAVCEEAPS